MDSTIARVENKATRANIIYNERERNERRISCGVADIYQALQQLIARSRV
jgi:hypothetical protein